MSITNWIELAVALATLSLAYVTWRMARYTRNMARETAAASRLSDLHHQEAIRPLLVIDKVTWLNISPLISTLNVELRNIGSAAALDVRYEFDGQVEDKRHPGQENVEHLAAGEARTVKIATSVFHEKWHNPTSWWRVDVYYSDAFGNDASAQAGCGATEVDNTYSYVPTVPEVRQQVLDEVQPRVGGEGLHINMRQRRKLLLLVLSLGVFLFVALKIPAFYRGVKADETRAIIIAQSDAADAGLTPQGLSPRAHRWTVHMTLTPGIYRVDLRTRSGDGWTWRVDVAYNDIKRVGPFPTPTPAAVAALPIPLSKLPDLTVAQGNQVSGAAVFSANCAACHGAAGQNGQVGPSLSGAQLTPGQVAYMVRYPQGVDPTSGMPKLPLTDEQVRDVAAYVASLR